MSEYLDYDEFREWAERYDAEFPMTERELRRWLTEYAPDDPDWVARMLETHT